MDKISPEEKIQWMKKILQKKESISSVASKIEFIIRPLINGLEIIKQLDRSFFRKGHTYRTPAQKKPLFSITFLEKVLSGYLCPAQNFRCTDTQKMDYEV